MANSVIRWTKDDRANLRRAVNNFNSKISRLEKLGRENLPEKASYRKLIGTYKLQEGELDQTIYSRQELKNVINSLSRFGKRGAEDTITLPSGEVITQWENREISIKQARVSRRINKEIASAKGSNFGLGDSSVQALEDTLEYLKKLRSKKGYQFKKGKEILYIQSSSDRELRKAINWEKNFNKRMESLKNFDGYDLLVQKLETIENPIKKWEYISQSEVLSDLFVWTDTDKIKDPNKHTYGGFPTDQDAFNRALLDLGLVTPDEIPLPI